MSRIGKKPIPIPDKVEVLKTTRTLTVNGPLGNLKLEIPSSIQIQVKDNNISLNKIKNDKKTKAIYGLYRTLINNMVIGVFQGFSKHLVIEGIGYRAQVDKKSLILNIGYSHIVRITPPPNVQIKTINNTEIIISGSDKALVGQTAAKIRAVRPPEPYKGKGIRYQQEFIKQKIGKTGK